MSDHPMIELSDALNTLLGGPYCPAACDHGGRCSLDNHHDDDHVALGSGGTELCRWENHAP